MSRAWLLFVLVCSCNAFSDRSDLDEQRALLEEERALLERERKLLADRMRLEQAEKRSGLRLELPRGGTSEIDPAIASLVIEIPAKGDVVVGGKAITDNQLDDLFRRAYARDKNTQVIIQADRDVGHGRVVAVMERAKASGLQRLAIGTRK